MANSQSQTDNAESRLSIHEVPEQISRIFFGKPEYSSSSYDSTYDSYGAPQAPPSYQAPNYDSNFYPGSTNGYFISASDYELIVRLIQVALIAFIILVIVVVIAILFYCCVKCPTLFGFGGRNENQAYNYQQNYPNNFTDFPITYSVEDKAANSGKRNKRKLPNNLLATRPSKQKAIYENLKPKGGQDVETGLVVGQPVAKNQQSLEPETEWTNEDSGSSVRSSSRAKTPNGLRRHKTGYLGPKLQDRSTTETELKQPFPESKRSHLDVTINRPPNYVQYDNPPTSSESSDQAERSLNRSINYDYEVPSRRFTVTAPAIRSPDPNNMGVPISNRPPNASLPPIPNTNAYSQIRPSQSQLRYLRDEQINRTSTTTASHLI